MKINHSKYKNTGILFELLTRQITTDILNNIESPAVNILKKYFNNSELFKEYKIYNTLVNTKVENELKANILIETTVNLYKKLNKSLLRNEKYNLIKEIKNHYNINEFFKYKINNYKPYASIYTLLEYSNSNNFIDPKEIVKNKITLLEHLTQKSQTENTKNKLVEEYTNSSKGMRYLTYKILVEKFNSKYSSLDKTQKEILKEYINLNNNPLLIKEFINNKFSEISNQLNKLINNIDEKSTKIKLQEVLNLIKPISKPLDDDFINLVNYYELIKELKLVK